MRLSPSFAWEFSRQKIRSRASRKQSRRQISTSALTALRRGRPSARGRDDRTPFRRALRSAGVSPAAIEASRLGGWIRPDSSNGLKRIQIRRGKITRLMSIDSDKHFAFRVAAVVTFGYVLAVVGATFVDAQITSHVLYGPRSYRYGYGISLLAIPLFTSTTMLLLKARTRGWRCAASVLPLLLTLGSEWVFAPEIPHQGMTGSALMYGIAAFLATWLRNTNPDMAYITDTQLPLQVRLEGLKSAITLWQGLAIATYTVLLAGVVPWSIAVSNTNTRVDTSARDLFLVDRVAMFHAIAISLTILIGPIREALMVLVRLTTLFQRISEGTTGVTGQNSGYQTNVAMREEVPDPDARLP